MASGALKGALIGAATGAVGGGMKSAMDYYEEHGTVDGSGSQILSGSAQGFATGAAAGTASGAMAGVGKYHKNPSGYCFIAGTLVLTAVGLTNIENIQPGDLVFAKEAVGIEQSVDVNQDSELAPVLEVYSHEVDETYVVTVDGESIETTANHPFYDENGEQVEAKDLEEGDELTTANGDTATVESVECSHHDEPVMVYNFCVMEDHTYFVGEHGVLVHNECDKSALNKWEKKLSENMDSRSTPQTSSSTALVEYYQKNNGAIPGTEKNIHLMEGDIIDRFGMDSGKYFSPAGTPLEMRALPYNADISKYTRYVVLKPFEVEASTIAPAFGKIGLGTQYRCAVNAKTLVRKGIIKPI